MENSWRCQVCGKAKDLRGPHLHGKLAVRSDCWPCAKKQTFLLPSGITRKSVGAEPATPVISGTATSTAALVSPVDTKATPPASDNPFLKAATAPAAATATSPATTSTPPKLSSAATSDSSDVSGGVWRCQVCGKAKDLRGPHLHGKPTVRSDCWPCAKKQTFVRGSASAGIALAAEGVGVPFLYTTTAATRTAAASPTGSPPSSSPGSMGAPPRAASVTVAATITASSSNPFISSATSGSKPLAATTTTGSGGDVSASVPRGWATSVNNFASAFLASSTGTSTSVRLGNGGNPFLAASARQKQQQQQLSLPSTATAAATGPPRRIFMEKSEGTSPPFTFKAATPYPAADARFTDPHQLLPASMTSIPLMASSGGPDSQQMAGGSSLARKAASLRPQHQQHEVSPTPSTTTPELVWVCSECRKKKDLHGDHLRGKSSVRSDCWPCGKKRLFILVHGAESTRRSPSLTATRGGGGGALTADLSPGPKMVRGRVGSGQHGCDENCSKDNRNNDGTTGVPPAPAVTNPSTQMGGVTAATTAADTNVSISPSAALRLVDATGDSSDQVPGWCAPVIPPNDAVTDFYLLPEDAEADLFTAVAFSLGNGIGGCDGITETGAAGGGDAHDTSAPAMLVSITPSQRVQAAFNAQLLQTFRLLIADGVPLHAAWYGSVLYVIAAEPPASALRLLSSSSSGSSSRGLGYGQTRQQRAVQEASRAYEAMGRFAALLMSVESKLAASRFRRVRRLFCPSEFSFAASCCYVSQFVTTTATSSAPPSSLSSPRRPSSTSHHNRGSVGDSPSSSAAPAKKCQAPFPVYGPKRDITRAPTVWSRVVDGCPHAVPCIVSEDQRVRASQQLYRRVSWLAMPADTTGAAVQLMQEERDAVNTNDAHDGEDPNATSGVDVVLLPSTMRLEDLPRAAALALPVKQF